jgi:hypothetical protein
MFLITDDIACRRLATTVSSGAVDRVMASRIMRCNNETSAPSMPPRVKRNYLFWAVSSAPAVAITYAVIAYAVVTVGCFPSFSAAVFFDVPVTFFLVSVATFAALIMIVFATLHALRALRARAQRRQRDRLQRRVGSILIVSFGIAIFTATAWGADHFLRATSCF